MQPGYPATQPPPATYPPASAYPPPGNYPPPAYPPPGAAPNSYPPPQPYAYPPPQGYGYPPPTYAQPAPPPGPEFLPYEPGQEVPSGYVLQSRPRRGLIIAGSLMVGVPYFIGLSFGGDLEDEDAWLYVPVLGPWFTLAGKDFSCDDNSVDLESEADCSVRTLLALDGLTQGAGVVLLIYGLASKSQRLVRQDLYQGFTLTPHFTGKSAGLWAAGQF